MGVMIKVTNFGVGSSIFDRDNRNPFLRHTSVIIDNKSIIHFEHVRDLDLESNKNLRYIEIE